MHTPPSGLSEHYALKALVERVLGRDAFLRVKEYAPLSAWKKETERLLKVLRRSIQLTVEVADSDWRMEVDELLGRGLSRIKAAPSIGELHAGLAATLGELAFLQVGAVPEYSGRTSSPPVNSPYWHLGFIRSVQYVQTPLQSAQASKLRARREASKSEA